MMPRQFVELFCAHLAASPDKCVTRIAFRYAESDGQ